MKSLVKFVRIMAYLVATSYAFNAAALTFNPSQSSLSFISVKKNTLAEINYFKQFSVSLHADGTFSLNINLSSVSTGIEVRDHRLRTFLFEVIRFPNARVLGQLSPSLYKDLKPGQYVRQVLSATLSLHGVQKKVSVPIEIVALADGTLRVSSLQPLLLNASQFGLANGINKLAEIAKLDAINSVVPVSFSFSFKR